MSTLGQKPKFKIIEIDRQYLIPQQVTVYEFDYEKANEKPDALPNELISEVKKYP